MQNKHQAQAKFDIHACHILTQIHANYLYPRVSSLYSLTIYTYTKDMIHTKTNIL